MGEQVAEQRIELFERHRRVVGIEGGLVVVGAELRAQLVVGMSDELIAQVPVEPEVMEEVVALEDPVLLDHPVVALAHERLEDRGADVGMVERRERVADVMDQRARDVLVVAISPVRARVAVCNECVSRSTLNPP